MSALGHKHKCAVHQPMSALLPIATAKADMCQWSCPLYPRKRTFVATAGMSAKGQKRTLSLYSITSSTMESTPGNGEAERLSGRAVDDELEFGRLQYRQVGWLSALEDVAGVHANLMGHFGKVDPITHQATRCHHYPV